MKKDLFKGVALGCALTICMGSAIAVNAEAIRKEIYAVYDNIRIVVNGKEVTPKDANGNVVEPFVYEGTTYLPVRAISNALGEDIDWDGDTKTVYIGGKADKEDVPMDKLKPISGDAFTTDASYNKTTHRGETLITQNVMQYYSRVGGNNYDSEATFVLNGEYKELTGFLIVPDSEANRTTTITFTNVDTGEIIDKFTTKHGEKPLKVTVDVIGIDRLKINCASGGRFYNAYLTPISAK